MRSEEDRAKIAKLLQEITTLRSEKPSGYFPKIRMCLWELAEIDDPFADFPIYRGTEETGRPGLMPDKSPRYDNFGDNSYP